jgi:hypothetical protein
MEKKYFSEGDQERIAADAKERSSSKRSGLGYQQQQQQQQQYQQLTPGGIQIWARFKKKTLAKCGIQRNYFQR